LKNGGLDFKTQNGRRELTPFWPEPLLKFGAVPYKRVGHIEVGR